MLLRSIRTHDILLERQSDYRERAKMRNHPGKRVAGIIIDIVMYTVMVLQMLYVFIGNLPHEILGIVLFACLIGHFVIKWKRIRAIFRGYAKKKTAVRISEGITLILFAGMILMAVSSMGVSRFLFPWFRFLSDSTFHRMLATIVLALSVLHGGWVLLLRTEKKKSFAAGILLCCALSLAMGLWAVPYLNRHFRRVEADYTEVVSGEKSAWDGGKPLVVYFTRVGNTDFDEDVDVVSGASLLVVSDELMGNTQIMADMLCDIIGCEEAAITTTGQHYPSSYNDTIAVARTELQENARPEILPIDVSGYETIILVYPIWWGTIPMPVATFLEGNDFAGKKILLVATQGSSGFSRSTADIREIVPDAEVTEGISVYCDDIPQAREALYQMIHDYNGENDNR